MPGTRTLTALAAAATTVPFALGAATLLGTGSPAAKAILTAKPAATLLTAKPAATTALAAASLSSRTLLAAQPVSALSKFGVSALKAGLFLSPEAKLRHETATRARA